MRATILLGLLLAMAGSIAAQEFMFGGSGGDVLAETPIYEIPADMTFQEYRDANRRISVGLMLMSIPVPGMLHFYADDDTKGWICVGAAGLGLASIATGALLAGDEGWPKSDYEIVEIDGNRYEKIPRIMEGDQIDYELYRIKKSAELETGVAVLIGFGAALIAGELIYDWIDGISTIERKRDAVRFKYGVGARNASIEPAVGTDGAFGMALKIE